MTKIASISVLGCGWLGLPLAEQLVTSGYQVNGSTTSEAKLSLLKSKGINPYLLDLPIGIDRFTDFKGFLRADAMVVNFPPRLRRDEQANFIKKVTSLNQLIGYGHIKKLIFVSSTAVYPELNRKVTESDTANIQVSGIATPLLYAEQMMLGHGAVIIRFCGLYGPKRHPGRFLSGKSSLKRGNSCVNLVHQQDAIAAILTLLKSPENNVVYNVCADKHPTRQVFYTKASEALGIHPPEFIDQNAPVSYKIIDSKKFKTTHGFEFQHPDPMSDL